MHVNSLCRVSPYGAASGNWQQGQDREIVALMSHLTFFQDYRSSAATSSESLHTCAASARLNDALPRAAAAPIKAVLVRVAAAACTSAAAAAASIAAAAAA